MEYKGWMVKVMKVSGISCDSEGVKCGVVEGSVRSQAQNYDSVATRNSKEYEYGRCQEMDDIQ